MVQTAEVDKGAVKDLPIRLKHASGILKVIETLVHDIYLWLAAHNKAYTKDRNKVLLSMAGVVSSSSP